MLKKSIEVIEAELKQALVDLKYINSCGLCKYVHNDCDKNIYPCDLWEWRGIKEISDNNNIDEQIKQ